MEALQEGMEQTPEELESSNALEEEGVEAPESKDVNSEQFTAMRNDINTLVQTVQSQANNFAQYQQDQLKPKKVQRSPEEMNELYAENPVLAMQEIVNSTLDSKMSVQEKRMSTQSEKTMWDEKARTDFPVEDPKFYAAMSKRWGEMAGDGYDVTHARSFYTCAKETARSLKVKAPTKKSKNFDEAEPTNNTPRARTPESKIKDNDSRIQFYMMRPNGDKSPKAVAEYKKYLADYDRKKGNR